MKSWIIVGAGPGVSLAVARRFGKGGYRIGLIARDQARLNRYVADLAHDNIVASAVAADAGDAGAIQSALQALMSELAGCNVLIYNAAVLTPGHPLEISTQQIEAEFAVNVLGAHHAVSAVAPAMVARGHGAILFTGGGLALEPYPEWTSLALGKAALRSLAISLFKELAPKGVHVCVLAICGIVKPGGPFDPGLIGEEYWRVATVPRGLEDREIVFQPPGTDPFYNDPDRKHADVSRLPRA